ncbi:MAG: hypothetical protein AABZ23_02745 [Deltaproteobacteria bacterium]
MEDSSGKVPSGQRFYDNLPLLFILGLAITVVSYTLWGLWEVWSQPTLP